MAIIGNVQHRQPSSLFLKFAKRCVDELCSSVLSVNSVVLASGDGFEVASVTNQSGFDSSKVAAVSSSLLSMVHAFTSEIRLNDCQSFILDAANGKAIIAHVPCDNYPMVLMVLTDEKALLGQVLHGMRFCSQRLVEGDLKLAN
ncbi:MAG: roadblock/LC7 domain-containing protein [Gammaproteobacteria bacterium]|nr:roadblock/LC7 domain-containing protein [Gammaproteobacteria bacterium]